jgi:hypothetical protein
MANTLFIKLTSDQLSHITVWKNKLIYNYVLSLNIKVIIVSSNDAPLGLSNGIGGKKPIWFDLIL